MVENLKGHEDRVTFGRWSGCVPVTPAL